MRPAIRAAITAGAVVVAVAIGLSIRTLYLFGVFTPVETSFAGKCNAISGISGAEDIAIDEKLGIAFVSAFDRRARLEGKSAAQDGLYVLALAGAPRLKKLTGTPKDFHPHGISLYRGANGDLTLFAINHRSDGSASVDSFTVINEGGPLRLKEIGSIQGGELVSPNAIAAEDRDRFYVTNDHASRTQLGRTFDDLLVLPRADILYFDGLLFHEVATGLNFPSGVALSPDGRYLYVSEAFTRRLDTYARQDVSGALERIDSLAIASNLDNLRFDSKGHLWVGSHPRALAMAQFHSDAAKPAPSEIFEVSLENDIPKAATLVYADSGAQIGGASVAAVSGRRLLIGSPLDAKILDCTMDR
jgi:arylesterase / paraoxonase